jgi:hypothetical protein
MSSRSLHHFLHSVYCHVVQKWIQIIIQNDGEKGKGAAHIFFALLPYSGLRRGDFSPADTANPEEMAPVGQTERHFPQRMHSGLLISLVTSTAMGQLLSHLPHPTHRLSSRRIWKKLKRLKRL